MGSGWPRPSAAELAPRIAGFTAAAGRPPGLGLVLAGDDPASRDLRPQQAADGGRGRLSRRAGPPGRHAPASTTRSPSWTASTATTPSTASWCSRRCRRAMGAGAEQRVFDAVRPDKDVDGFHAQNVGLLVQKRARLVACTPTRRDRSCWSARGLRSPAATPSSSAAATSSASRWRCCCCIATPRSRSATRARPTSPRVARQADILVAGGRPPGLRHAGLRQARGDGDRRRHQPRHRRRAVVAPGIPTAIRAARQFEAKGSLVVGDVHPDGRGRGRRPHAGARRRRAADHRHAAAQHGRGGREPRAGTLRRSADRDGVPLFRRRADRAASRRGQEPSSRPALACAAALTGGIATVDADARCAPRRAVRAAGHAPGARARSSARFGAGVLQRRRRARSGRRSAGVVFADAARAPRPGSASSIRGCGRPSPRSSPPLARPRRPAWPRFRSSTRPGWVRDVRRGRGRRLPSARTARRLMARDGLAAPAAQAPAGRAVADRRQGTAGRRA